MRVHIWVQKPHSQLAKLRWVAGGKDEGQVGRKRQQKPGFILPGRENKWGLATPGATLGWATDSQ